ncbi:MAG: PAS domain-containing protein [Alphaproteobacteria bacterium]|nr:MAG: PAS domain-containing protein [Alphaproteobacteria bacterium]
MSSTAGGPAREEALFSALPVAALILDAADRVLAANPAAELLFNRSARQLAGRAAAALMRTDPPLGPALGRVRAGHPAVFLNDVPLTLPGRARPEPCNLRLGAQGESGEVVVLIEPRSLAGRLDHAAQARSAARAAMGLAQMLAHEIRNPLAGITGAAQLLEMSLPAGERELTGLILAETRRILKLLDEVERFGDQRPPMLAPINIHDVLERARRSARLGFAAHMTIRDAYDPSLPPVLGDADQLTQVFLNLMKNAAEASPAGGTITLRSFYEMRLTLADAEGARRAVPIHVEVIDDGPGIPPEIREELFEPFVSGRENGTGLGLALVSKIVTGHGGMIEVESEPGRTLFRVSLPMARGAAEGEEG